MKLLLPILAATAASARVMDRLAGVPAELEGSPVGEDSEPIALKIALRQKYPRELEEEMLRDPRRATRATEST